MTRKSKGGAIPLPAWRRDFGLQEAEDTRITRQSAYEGGNVVSPMHRSPLPPEDIPGKFNVHGSVYRNNIIVYNST